MIALVAAASWAYHVNYRTKQSLGRIDKLRAHIAAEREAVEVLRVEWAYLNSPSRLTRLVSLNADRLGLVPMSPRHFDDVAVIPFDVPEAHTLPALSGGVDIAPAAEFAASLVAVFEMDPVPLPRPAAWRGQ
jgi:hypothetical protein